MPQNVRPRWLRATWLYPTASAAFAIALSMLLLTTEGSVLRWGGVGAALLLATLGGALVARRDAALRAMGSADPLTNLPNRRYFEQCLERELIGAKRSGEPLALLVVDVDALKRVNDQLGHHAGDAAIRVVADALRGTCRGSDLPARWGGDEFVVLAPNTNEAQALALVDRISAALPVQSALSNAMARLEGQTTVPAVTASIGFAIASADQPGSLWAKALFAAADQSMYGKKQKSPRRITGPLTPMAHSPRPLTARLQRFEAVKR
jgi:diguanylate cyclase (GGDEF)-like protein